MNNESAPTTQTLDAMTATPEQLDTMLVDLGVPAERLLLPDHTLSDKANDIVSVKSEDAKDLPTKQPELESPKSAKQRKVREYLNAEGKPLVSIEELYDEMSKKVASGDESNWTNLVQTVRDSEKYAAKQSGSDVVKLLSDFQKFAKSQHAQLQLNILNKQPEVVSFKERIANLGKKLVEMLVPEPTLVTEDIAKSAESEKPKKESLAFRAGYKLGYSLPENSADTEDNEESYGTYPPVVKPKQTNVPEQKADSVEFAQIDDAEMQGLSQEELHNKYLSMHVDDTEGIAKIVSEQARRDLVLGLDKEVQDVSTSDSL